MEKDPPIQLITIDKVASMLSVSRRSVERLSSMGHLHPIHLSSRAVRYDQAEVIRYVEYLRRNPFRNARISGSGD